jgi:hypothetical protein
VFLPSIAGLSGVGTGLTIIHKVKLCPSHRPLSRLTPDAGVKVVADRPYLGLLLEARPPCVTRRPNRYDPAIVMQIQRSQFSPAYIVSSDDDIYHH